MSEHYTDEDVRQAMHVLNNYEPARPMSVTAETKGAATFVLDVVAPAIAARAKAEALRDFAHGLAIARIVSDHDPDQIQTSQTLTAVIDDMFDRADALDPEPLP